MVLGSGVSWGLAIISWSDHKRGGRGGDTYLHKFGNVIIPYMINTTHSRMIIRNSFEMTFKPSAHLPPSKREYGSTDLLYNHDPYKSH